MTRRRIAHIVCFDQGWKKWRTLADIGTSPFSEGTSRNLRQFSRLGRGLCQSGWQSVFQSLAVTNPPPTPTPLMAFAARCTYYSYSSGNEIFLEEERMNPFMQIRSNDYSWRDMNDGCPVTHSRLASASLAPIAKLGGQVRSESFSIYYILD